MEFTKKKPQSWLLCALCFCGLASSSQILIEIFRWIHWAERNCFHSLTFFKWLTSLSTKWYFLCWKVWRWRPIILVPEEGTEYIKLMLKNIHFFKNILFPRCSATCLDYTFPCCIMYISVLQFQWECIPIYTVHRLCSSVL